MGLSRQFVFRILMVVGWGGSLLVMVTQSRVSAADLTRAEETQTNLVNRIVRAAGKHYAAGRYEEANAQIKSAWKLVKEASENGSPELQQSLLPAIQRIRKAHTLLSLEGVAVPPITLPADFGKRKLQKPTPNTAEDMDVDDQVSFTKSITPLLVNRCGKCHISQAKGGFRIDSYAGLMKGPPEGVVIFPGDPVGSRLLELIETGDMPRGGGEIPPGELALITQWVKAGAKFDGDDPMAALSSEKRTSFPSTTEMPTTQMGSGTISFAKDIAGLLVKNCNGCHINARQLRGGLRMDNFSQLLRGGASGPVVQAGQGTTSMLVQRLRGIGGDRMPGGGRPPLSEAEIQRIAKWIDEGALFDGKSDRQPLETVHKLAMAGSATPAEMTVKRAELAQNAMNLTVGSGKPVQTKETEHFRASGAVSKATIDLVAKLAESQIPSAAKLVSSEVGERFFTGKATIFVFNKRYDYSEFAKMTEQRSLPRDWTSHWSFDGIHPYVAVVATDRDDEDEVRDRLISPILSLAVVTRGSDVPRWFAEGIGVAARNSQKKWTRSQRNEQAFQLSAAIAQVKDAKQFLEGKLPPEVSDRVGAAISLSLISKKQRKKFSSMMRELKGGKSFEEAFLNQYRETPESYIQRWLAYAKS